MKTEFEEAKNTITGIQEQKRLKDILKKTLKGIEYIFSIQTGVEYDEYAENGALISKPNGIITVTIRAKKKTNANG